MTSQGHEHIKDIIARHSIKLFEQKGFSETSIQDITNAAGVTKGIFYCYYASKGNLLLDILLQYICDLLEKQKAIMQTVKGFRRQLSEIVALIVYDMKSRKAHGQVYLREMHNLSLEHAEKINKKREEFRLNVTQVIAEGIQAGEFDAHLDPSITCMAILGITNWSYQWFNQDGKLSVEALADEYIAIILYGIAAAGNSPKKRSNKVLNEGGILMETMHSVKTMKCIQFTEYGGPEVLQWIEMDVPVVGEREVLVEVKAIGVNYADTARREGKYVVPTKLPFIPGSEIAGIVVAVGKEVTRFFPGMRVVSMIESGAYAEYASVHEMALSEVPEGVSFTDAVALPLQGQTAYHILTTMGRLEKGETVLVHAAAGGVGALSVQLAKLLGAGKIIATASSEEKLAHAKELGADELVNYTKPGWEQQVRELTGGKGVDVALEMVGGEVFQKTLKCLAPFGRLVVFGAASGEDSPMLAGQLMRRNHSVIGFFLPQIMAKQELYQRSMKELLHYVENGELKLTIGGVYQLEEAAEVHRLLQGRKTIGKLVLVP